MCFSSEFDELLERLVPRNDYLLQRNSITWPVLLANFEAHCPVTYIHFVAEFGPCSAQAVFEEHQRSSREWWFERRLTARLPMLIDVLRRLFDRSFLCQVKWEELITAAQAVCPSLFLSS